jgi:hypothetical protein
MSERTHDGPLGRVYQWEISKWGAPGHATHGLVRLKNLAGWPTKWEGLRGRFVTVRNAAVVNQPGPRGEAVPTGVGDAQPDDREQLIFESGRGGGRIDKVRLAEAGLLARYIQASRFGEVNTYHHVDRIASHVDALLREIGAASLPPVVAVVNAHHAAVDPDGARDGRRCPDGRWVPFQGGHYRLPGRVLQMREHQGLSPDGEIHLGPGQKLTSQGALARFVGGPYRANASHNPAIIYHEYGHHITRHTADFRANRRRAPERQNNLKTALDEGTADYFAAAMLGTPHIWFFHQRDDELSPHRRCLLSNRTMAHYVRGRTGDPHANGTIWATTLWELRGRVEARASPPAGGNAVDRLVLHALLLIGQIDDAATPGVCAARRSFRRAGLALLEADRVLYRGALRDTIASTLAARQIHPEASTEPAATAAS